MATINRPQGRLSFLSTSLQVDGWRRRLNQGKHFPQDFSFFFFKYSCMNHKLCSRVLKSNSWWFFPFRALIEFFFFFCCRLGRRELWMFIQIQEECWICWGRNECISIEGQKMRGFWVSRNCWWLMKAQRQLKERNTVRFCRNWGLLCVTLTSCSRFFFCSI